MDDTCVIGIDLGGTYIKGAALDRTGKILSEGKVETEVAQGQARVLENVTRLVADLRKRSRLPSLAGGGLGVPGALDFEKAGSLNHLISRDGITSRFVPRSRKPSAFRSSSKMMPAPRPWESDGSGRRRASIISCSLPSGPGSAADWCWVVN